LSPPDLVGNMLLEVTNRPEEGNRVAGSEGDGEGTVFLAHAWVPDEHRRATVGPWHWWNVYTAYDVAEMQAVRRARGWSGGRGKYEVRTIAGGAD